MIDAIPRPNCGCALLKWIPGDPKAGRKIVLLGLVEIFTKRRGGWSAIERCRSSLEVLGIHDHAVTEIAGTRTPTCSPGYDWRIRSIPKTRKKVGEQTIPIPRRAK